MFSRYKPTFDNLFKDASSKQQFSGWNDCIHLPFGSITFETFLVSFSITTSSGVTTPLTISSPQPFMAFIVIQPSSFLTGSHVNITPVGSCLKKKVLLTSHSVSNHFLDNDSHRRVQNLPIVPTRYWLCMHSLFSHLRYVTTSFLKLEDQHSKIFSGI